MTDTEIKAGDVVQLKSGGPPMTVESIGNYELMEGPQANCQWFDRNGEAKTALFRNRYLEKEGIGPIAP